MAAPSWAGQGRVARSKAGSGWAGLGKANYKAVLEATGRVATTLKKKLVKRWKSSHNAYSFKRRCLWASRLHQLRPGGGSVGGPKRSETGGD